MDSLEPLLVAALSSIAKGSLGAAGSQLWQELKELVTRREEVAVGNLEVIVLDQATDDDVKALARELAREAGNDPQLRSHLEDWGGRVEQQIDGDVSNSVTGNVHGKVVQARDIGSLRID